METDKNKQYRFENTSGRIFSALFLISLGIVFLLNTTGVVSWSVWGGFALLFVKIWPIFLVLVGLQIIFGKNLLSHIFFSIVWFLIFAAGIFIGIVNYSEETSFTKELKSRFDWLINLDLSSDAEKTESTFNTNETEYNSQELTINLKSGELTIAEDGELDGMQIKSDFYDNYGEPQIKETMAGKVQKVEFEQYFQQGLLKFSSHLAYNFVVGDMDKPLDLELNLTAGTTDIEFEEKSINKVVLNMVAGSASMDFSEESLPNIIDLSLTAGSVEIDLPNEIELTISNSSIAGSTTVFGERLNARESRVFNKGAKIKVEITVNQTAGSLTIN